MIEVRSENKLATRNTDTQNTSGVSHKITYVGTLQTVKQVLP